MKNIFVFVFCFTAILAAFGQPFSTLPSTPPRQDDWLLLNRYAGGVWVPYRTSVSNFVISPYLSMTNSIYVAYRTDGREGSGTVLDPRDGSTFLKFDQILSNAPRHTIVYLYPSTNYETRGAAAHAYADGRSYRGIRKFVSLIGLGGSTMTKITLRSDATNQFGISTIQAFMFGESSDGLIYDADNTGVEFSGLEVDCNAQNNPMTNYCISGVGLISHRVVVRDVIVRNTRGFGNIESFGLVVTDNSDHSTILPELAGGSIVENYRFMDNVPDPHHAASWIYPSAYSYTTGLILNYRNTNYTRVGRSVVRNCTISSTNAWTWVGLSGNRAVEMAGNYVGQSVHGFYTDTGALEDVDIHNNTFRDLSTYGIRINGPAATALWVRDNSISYMAREGSERPASPAARYTFALQPAFGMTMRNIVFSGNQIGFPTNAPSSTYYLYLGIKGGSGSVTNVLVHDNIIPFANTWSTPACGLGMTYANNRTHAWALMATNDVATP
jgi:hypothetical protein